jgi:hypothetical protein
MNKLIDEVRLNYPLYNSILQVETFQILLFICRKYLESNPQENKLTNLIRKTEKEISIFYSSLSPLKLYLEFQGEENITDVSPSFKAVDNLVNFIKKRMNKIEKEIKDNLFPLETQKKGYFSKVERGKIEGSLTFPLLILSTSRIRGENQCCDFEVILPGGTPIIQEGDWILVPASEYKVKKVKRDVLKNFEVLLIWETQLQNNSTRRTLTTSRN